MDEGKCGAADDGGQLLRLLDLIEVEEPASVWCDGARKGGGGSELFGNGFEHVDERGVRSIGAARSEDEEVEGLVGWADVELKRGDERLFVHAEGFSGMEVAAGLVGGGAAGVEGGGAIRRREDG